MLIVGPKEAGFKYAGKNTYPATSTHSIADINHVRLLFTHSITTTCTQSRQVDIDALVIPGGWAPGTLHFASPHHYSRPHSDYWRRDARFLQLVRDLNAANKPIGSICHGVSRFGLESCVIDVALAGPWLLVSAGVLKGKTATCFVSIKDDVINAGATYVDQEVCTSSSSVLAV